MNLQKIKNSKVSLIAISVFILLSFILFLATSTKKPGQTHVKDNRIFAPDSIETQKNTPSCDGYDWQKIATLNMNDTEKFKLKFNLLKLSLESSILSANPVIAKNANFPGYIQYINMFYKDPNNMDVPLFFALKIADMSKNGSSEKELAIFKLAILQKLSNANILK